VVETGFDPAGAWTAYLDLSLEGYDTAEGQIFQADLLASLRSLGWVTQASLSTDLPLDLSRSSTGVFPAGWDDAEDQRALGVDFNRVSDGYFETLGIPVLQGRPFASSDREGNAPVVIVSEAFVEAAWTEGRPLGRTVQIGRGGDARVFEVVGVVEDVKNQLITDDATPFLYLPLGQEYGSAVQVVVRTPVERARAVPGLREAILEMDPSLSLGSVVSLERFTSVGILPQRIAAALTSALGLLALLLSGLGIYGVISYAVGRRRREIGIRMALGEGRGSVIARFVWSGLRIALPGMVVGGILAILGGRLLRALLLDLSPHDPVALGGVSLLLVGVVMVATWLPARRAARVDPARSLRVDQ
jgi:predicted permease